MHRNDFDFDVISGPSTPRKDREETPADDANADAEAREPAHERRA